MKFNCGHPKTKENSYFTSNDYSRCKICRKKYYNNNKERLNKIHKEWLKKNKEWCCQHTKQWLKENRWYKHYGNAEQRCNNPNNRRYKSYGKRGIKFLMTPKDFKYLWLRDKAYLMKRPSIDRKNNNGNYTLKNCRFIELLENTRRKRK